MIVPGPGVFVPAPVAARLERALVDALRKAERKRLPIDPATAAVIAEVSDLAAWWRASAASAALDSAAPAGGSSQSMTTIEAGELLGVSDSRVRQLLRAGDLPGTRANGRWQVDRAAVAERGTA
jgi:excisionase family DNA binding protein